MSKKRMMVSDIEVDGILGVPLDPNTLPERSLWAEVLKRAAIDFVNLRNKEIKDWFADTSDELGTYNFCLHVCNISHLRESIVTKLTELSNGGKLRRYRSPHI